MKLHRRRLARGLAVSIFGILLSIGAGQRLAAQTPSNAPSWWTNYGVLSSTTSADYAVANQGQAKWAALQAVSELDNDLAQFGGAGANLDNLAATLLASDTGGSATDYAAINLGQLKTLVQPFYDRLLALGYDGAPINSGTAITTGTYPWIASGYPANDYAAANLGQLKYAFSFDVTSSSTGDLVPDWWLQKYFPGQTMTSGSFTDWSNEVTLLQAYQQGLDPIDFYNGQPPNLNIVSGNYQTGSPGGFVPLPLVVSLTDTNGNSLYGAPVTFTATSGSMQLSSTGAPTTAVTLLTNWSGQAQVFFQLPESATNTSVVSVTTGTGASATSGTFSEFSDDGTGVYPSPFAPSDIVTSINADGSETITWQNNDSQSPIYVYLESSSSTWSVSGTLAAGTTSYIVSGSNVNMVEIGNNYSPGGDDALMTGTGGGGGSGGGTDPGGRFTPIPVCSYAAIDISGTTTTSGTNALSVGQMAMDDSSNVAFPISSGSNVAVYRWASLTGSLSHIQDITVGTFGSDTDNDSVGVSSIAPNGIAYGTHGHTESSSDSLIDWSAVAKFTGGSYVDIFVPNPPFAPYTTTVDGTTKTLGPYAAASSSNNSGFLGWASSILSSTSANFGYFISCGGTTIFGTNISGGGSVINSDFEPIEMSTAGSAIGYSGSGTPEIWAGGSVVNSPLVYDAGINNLGQVIGQSGTTGYLWYGGTTYTISQLIPLKYQPEVGRCIPILVSGTDSNGSVKILFDGLYSYDSNGDQTDNLLMLTLTSGTNPAVITGSNANTLQVANIQNNAFFSDGREDSPPYPTMLSAQGQIGGTGGMNGDPVDDGTPMRPIICQPCELAVDANRDGTIVLPEDPPQYDSSGAPLPVDTTSQAQPYRFWINNNEDVGSVSNITGTTYYTVPPQAPDYQSPDVVSTHDLEDWARLWVYTKGINTAIQSGQIKVGLKWASVVSGTPGIEMITASGTGGLDYLSGTTGAAAQAAEDPSDPNDAAMNWAGYLNRLIITDTDDHLTEAQPTENAADFVLPQWVWHNLSETSPKTPFLFEGRSKGFGQLQIVFLLPDGITPMGYGGSVWLDIRDVKEMYQREIAGGAGPTYHPPLEPYVSARYTSFNAAALTNAVDSTFPFVQPWDETDQCAVFVHGFNTSYDDFTNDSEILFKRLWWQGYKGRLIGYNWPALTPPAGFNSSEWNAWIYGTPFMSFVSSLKGEFKPITVIAHSQGNVVVGSAIKQGLAFDNYIMLQAALPTGCYATGTAYNSYTPFTSQENPQVTPDTAAQLGYRGYIQPAMGNVGAYYCFYNPIDFALHAGQVTIANVTIAANWENDQEEYKPDPNPGRGGWGRYETRLTVPYYQSNLPGPPRQVTDIRESVSFVARPRSQAAGEDTNSPAVFGTPSFPINLQTSYGFSDQLFDHSGEFERDYDLVWPLYQNIEGIVSPSTPQ